MKTVNSVGIIIPTRNNEQTLKQCLEGLKKQVTAHKILVIDSSSADRTVEIARTFGTEVHIIPRHDFNHGATRELGRKLLGTDIVVMMTADAFVLEEDTINKLIAPILSREAVVSYARQLPRMGAGLLESVPRLFNYPPESHIRNMADIPEYGVYTFFCSNSCAAYLNSALDDIGGFEAVLTNEDYFAVARMLKKGHKIAYVAEARVEHSHRYSILEDFRRYFDTGYVRAEHDWVNKMVGQAEGRGIQLFKLTLDEVKQKNIFLLPKTFFVFFARWLGFRLGYLFIRMPRWLNKLLSSQPYYWDSKYYKQTDKRS